MRKFTSILLLITLTLSAQSTLATTKYGPWAHESIINAAKCNIIDINIDYDYYAPITRSEIAKIIANAYSNIKGDFSPSINNIFTDTSDRNISIVSELGIMNGYGDGTFLPNATTSRQEMAKILLTYQSALKNEAVSLTSNSYCNFTDFNTLSSWAKPYVVTAVEKGLLNGYEDGTFNGLKPVSWQEAIVMIERVAKFSEPTPTTSCTVSTDFDLRINLNDQIATVSWNKVQNNVHTLTITEQRLSRYEGDIPPNTPEVITFIDETHYTFNTNPNKLYTIRISCNNIYYEKSIRTNSLHFDDMDEIYSTYPTTKEEAEQLLVDVTVPIWRLNGTTKVASSATFKIHKSIAEKVKLVFEEIFNGKEQFPIKDIGGYSWRGSRSEHNGGTAIDINSNENYCIYNNGTTIGSYWKPFEDPYSITPYGDVIRAFEKYGFTWGGDSWSNPKDYMHFSYLGT